MGFCTRRALILYAHIQNLGVGKECAVTGRATGAGGFVLQQHYQDCAAYKNYDTTEAVSARGSAYK